VCDILPHTFNLLGSKIINLTLQIEGPFQRDIIAALRMKFNGRYQSEKFCTINVIMHPTCYTIDIRGGRQTVRQVAEDASEFLKQIQNICQVALPRDSWDAFKQNWPLFQAHIHKAYPSANVDVQLNHFIVQNCVNDDLHRILEELDSYLYLCQLQDPESEINKLATRRNRMETINLQEIGIGGLSDEFKQLIRSTFLTRTLSAQFQKEMGLTHTKGVILHGPPGCGKTSIARHIGDILGTKNVTYIHSPELENKFVGETERHIRELFQPAREKPEELHLLIFDEIDAITRKRGGTNAKARDGSVFQLLCEMDGLKQCENLIVIGLTNRMEDMDKALLRPGRFEAQIEIALPDEHGRIEIFEIMLERMRRNSRIEDLDIQNLAQMTDGFSGADIEGAVRLASSMSIENMATEETCKITNEDMEEAIQEVRHTKLVARKPTERKQSNDKHQALLTR